MAVIIKNMDMPEKCCKCPILHKSTGVCPLLRRRVVDPGKKHEDCPLNVVEACNAKMLRQIWANEPEVLDSIEKAVIA